MSRNRARNALLSGAVRFRAVFPIPFDHIPVMPVILPSVVVVSAVRRLLAVLNDVGYRAHHEPQPVIVHVDFVRVCDSVECGGRCGVAVSVCHWEYFAYLSGGCYDVRVCSVAPKLRAAMHDACLEYIAHAR